MKVKNIDIKNKPLLFTGVIFIVSGFLFNEWSIARLLTSDGSLSTYSRYLIWVLDLILIFVGCILIINNDWFVLRWGGIAILAISVISLLVGYIFRMGYIFQIDYNEGWNVYQSLEASAGKPLYSDHETLTPVIYPPLSFYVVGYAGILLHNTLVAGRVISLISLIMISLEVGVIVWLLSKDHFASIFSGVYCLGLFVAYAWGYVAMNDPQMLGHVLILAGLIVYLKYKSKLILVAFLCCLGLFTKHNLFPIPLAITIDVFLHSRKDFFKWVIANIVISGIFLLLILFNLGPEFIYNILTPRGFDPQRLIQFMNRRFGPLLLINLVLTLPWLYHAMKNNRSRIIPVYMLISIVWGVFALCGIGSDINLVFDFFISLSIASGMSLYFICKKFESLGIRLILVSILAPMILGTGILYGFRNRYPRNYTFQMYEKNEQVFLTDALFLSSKTSPLICSNMLLCYVADHPLVMDPFLTSEGIMSGRFQEDEILAQLESGYYKVIQLDYPLDDPYFEGRPYTSVQRSNTIFTENFLRALGNNYVLTRETSVGAYYEPR